MITLEHVTKRYGSFKALEDVSLSIPQGQVLGLLGPNGAGKTTLLNILTGCLAPSSGEVKIDAHDLLLQPREAKRQIGYLPESAPLYPEMRVKAYLRFVCRLREVKENAIQAHILEIAELTGLTDVLSRPIGNLSKGYAQRVGLAQALCGYPGFLILDEPT
ncbi:MAG: ABC transporter ATP-binding protein, partial [Clostridia bacterium]|nr:ABC transporter ATP-binding protein [Clostridia bacterium]